MKKVLSYIVFFHLVSMTQAQNIDSTHASSAYVQANIGFAIPECAFKANEYRVYGGNALEGVTCGLSCGIPIYKSHWVLAAMYLNYTNSINYSTYGAEVGSGQQSYYFGNVIIAGIYYSCSVKEVSFDFGGYAGVNYCQFPDTWVELTYYSNPKIMGGDYDTEFNPAITYALDATAQMRFAPRNAHLGLLLRGDFFYSNARYTANETVNNQNGNYTTGLSGNMQILQLFLQAGLFYHFK
jgi:hypothetical protein